MANSAPDIDTRTRTNRQPLPWRYTPRVWAACLTLVWAAIALAYLARPTSHANLQPRDTGYRLRINHDDATQLQLLSGIGPRIADNIVHHRRHVGPFRNFDQLEDVPAIGPRTRQRFQPWISLEPPTHNTPQP